MLKDITIGQYFPGDSVIHRMDSRFKIVLDIVFVAALFSAQTFAGLFVGLAFVIFSYFLARIKFKLILKSIKPIIPLLIFTGVLNLFFIKGDNVVVDWGFITIYAEGLRTSGFMIVRIVSLIIAMSLLTYTTSPIMLTDAIESLLSPFKKLKLPVHELAMMMTIALRFIPTLIEETDKIMMAQKARGASLDTGGIMQKAKALVPILIPLFISAFKRANELAMAMECRCYRGGEGRTRLVQLKSGRIDYISSALLVLVFGVVVTCNFIFPM